MYSDNTLYQFVPGLVLGFHGTKKDIVKQVVSGEGHLKQSENEYDWLGPGIYFWEYGPQRAYEFALEKAKRDGTNPDEIAVVGAVIDPGHCFNLLEASALAELQGAFEVLQSIHGENLPQNKGGDDLLMRYLDCAVIQMAHELRDFEPPQEPYDTVRGAFWEGDDLYPNAGFKHKNHVQLCVRSIDCIKGYFLPIVQEKIE